MNNSGEKRSPWGTPEITEIECEMTFLYLTRSLSYECNESHDNKESAMTIF